jgi:predicted transcriptional regulator
MELHNLKEANQMENLSCDDILQCMLGVNELDTHIILALEKNPKTIQEIAQETRRDRTTIQRAVAKLLAMSIIHRKSKSSGKGRKYVYHAIAREQLTHLLLEDLDKCYRKIRSQIMQLQQ